MLESVDLLTKLVLRLVVASFCGAIIGFERQKREKVAGVRTHFIVCMAACLTMLLSKYAFFDVLNFGQENDLLIRLDPARIAAGTVTAIGFLGAGTIVITKRTVMGVTTAAGIWATVGVGLTVGAGFYITGIFATVFMMGFSVFLHHFFPDKNIVLLRFEGERDYIDYRTIKFTIEEKGLEVRSIRWDSIDQSRRSLDVQCLLPKGMQGEELVTWTATLPNFKSFESGF